MSEGSERGHYDPLEAGRSKVTKIETEARAAGKSDAEVKSEVETTVKRSVEDQRINAKDGRREFDARGSAPKDPTVATSVITFLESARKGYIDPPPDAPSKAVFTSLVTRLPGTINNRTAPYLHKLIDGLINTPNYVQLNPDSAVTTAFEKDLSDMFSRFKEDEDVRTLVTTVLTDAVASGAMPGVTEDHVKAKIDAALEAKQVALVHDDSDLNRQEETFIMNLLENSPPEIRESVSEFFQSLSSPENFHKYYEKILGERGGDSKEVTRQFQKNLMYIVYTIYSPVLATKGMEFNAAVSASGGSYMQNPNTIFSRLRNKLTYLTERIPQFSDEYDKEPSSEEHALRYFQVGEEEIDTYHDGEDGAPGRFVRETVPTKDLMPCTFKDFVANMRLTTETLKDLLEVGINAAFLHETGHTEGNKSFYKQKAAYAQHKLQASRIDELYSLPYASFVNAVGKQLDSYLKIQMSLNRWKRDPKMVTKIFEKMENIEEEVLHDLIKHYREEVPDEERVPEWAILPAILHARTHLIMISMQPEAIAGYANAAVDDEGNPTYKSQIMANLTVNQTWSDAEQWRSTDSLLKGVGFLPQPNRYRAYEDWRPEIVIPEGENVYKDTFRYGKMAAEGRIYFDGENMPNVLELNPMNYGGVEQQMGWRVRYPYLDWLSDMIDHSAGPEALKTEDPHVYEYAWKRLENIGVHVLKSFREDMLFNGGLLKQEGDRVKGEEQYKNFFKFLYRRYFQEGVGKEGMSMSVIDSDLVKTDVDFSRITSEEDFWNRVVSPILHRKVTTGDGESEKDAAARNTRERTDDLKEIVHRAMTVIAFERMPTDFLTIENPTRSQNGNTFMDHLLKKFVGEEEGTETDTPEGKYRNQHKVHELLEAVRDISFVEMEVQRQTDDDGKKFVLAQVADDEHEHKISPKTLFGRTKDSLAGDRSEVRSGRGYTVGEEDIKDILGKRYGRDSERVHMALEVYREIREQVVKPPDRVDFSVKPALEKGGNDKTRMKVEIAMKKGIEPKQVTDAMVDEYYPQRKQELTKIYNDYQDRMSTRLMWTGDEVFKSTTGLVFHDTIFGALRMANSGSTVVSRTIDAVANTQEFYKNKQTGGDMLSALSGYSRKGDTEKIVDGVKEVRASTKMEDEDKGNWIGMRMAENAMNAVRIDSRAENPIVEGDFRLLHRRRSAMSVVVKEGEEFTMHREDRYGFVTELLHSSLIGDKRVKPENRVYDLVEGYSRAEQWKDKVFLGEQIGKVADWMFGKKAGKYVRNGIKESTGNALRDREIANIMDIVRLEVPSKLVLALIALMILLTLTGYKDADEAS